MLDLIGLITTRPDACDDVELSNIHTQKATVANKDEEELPAPSQATHPSSPTVHQQQDSHSPMTIGLARDFYALERTWLAYNRTANTLVSHGVIVSQLFFLHEGHKGVGRVCAIVMISGGIVLELIGATRYVAQSRGLLEADPVNAKYGRAIVGNLSVVPSAAIIAFVCCGLFVLVLVAT